MERLNLNSISDIVYRLRRGQSERAIAKDLGHSRNTVRHYHNLAREKGYLDLHRVCLSLTNCCVSLARPRRLR
jgi:predicted transcriptional regulator